MPDQDPQRTPEQAPQQLPQNPPGGGAAVAEAPKATSAPARPNRKVENLPPFRVLLHNDDVNTVEFVISSLMELTTLGFERSVQVTREAHNSGVALVLVTHRERAELFKDQFTSKGLTVTIEPAA